MTDFLLPVSSARVLAKINNRLFEIESKHPGLLQKELFDFLEVLVDGAEKYSLNNWLDSEGKKCSEKEMHDSMFHHLAESFTDGVEAVDKDSLLDPLLHLQCRAGMLYTRREREIVHPLDK